MAEQEIGLFEAMYSQRAIRSLKTDPVPREVLHKIIEAATKAPSGGNRQPWAFIAIQDRGVIEKIAEHAKAGFAVMYERALARMKPGDPMPLPRLKPLAENFEKVPAIVIPCYVGAPGSTDGAAAGASSIYPAVQNMLLAARGLGIGAVLTNLALSHEAEVKELLGVPEHVSLMAVVPMGYPDKEHYGSTTRRPLSEVAHWDRWGNQQA